MKYFNKTRTIEDEVNNRDLLRILVEQNQLLKTDSSLSSGKSKSRIMRSLILGCLLCFLLYSCASWKSVQKKEETKSHHLPPNTASNKYAKKRN